MTTFDRPAPEIAKIVEAWTLWQAGGDVLPGRTMADLKIAGTDKVLETLAEESDAVAPAFEAWMQWERGKSAPAAALAELSATGFADIVEALAVGGSEQ